MRFKKKKIRKILLLVEKSRAAGTQFIKGFSRYANIYGPWQIYSLPPLYLTQSAIHLSRQTYINWFAQIKKIDIDAVVLRDMYSHDDFRKMGIPILVFREIVKKVPKAHSISTDSRKISSLASEYFLARGYKNFIFCGFSGIPWSEERNKYFIREIEKEGLKAHSFNFSEYKKTIYFDKELNKLSKLIKSLPKPLAIFSCNDDCSQKVLEACRNVNLRIPEDAAILGVDNDELICNLANPTLSSIVLNFEKAGFETAEILDLALNRKLKKFRRLIVEPTEVVTRASTDIIAIESSDVKKAIKFIRTHGDENITVTDVVSATSVSRRVLEKLFAKELNKSIHSLIKQTRVFMICKMLTETNMTIKEVAHKLNFTNTNHISRYFKSEKSITLTDYRRKYKT